MITAELIERHAERWVAATTHPFLDGARDGTLDEETFGRWLGQDRLFVIALTRTWGTLLSSAPLADFELISGGLSAFTAELTWFEQLASESDLSLDVELNPDTASYIGFLEELAGSPYAVAMTAMWAVEAAYLHAWRGALGGAGHYAPVVEHWANAEFAAFVDELARVADRELAAAPVRHSEAEEAFLGVLEHEAAFWALGGAA